MLRKLVLFLSTVLAKGNEWVRMLFGTSALGPLTRGPLLRCSAIYVYDGAHKSIEISDDVETKLRCSTRADLSPRSLKLKLGKLCRLPTRVDFYFIPEAICPRNSDEKAILNEHADLLTFFV